MTVVGNVCSVLDIAQMINFVVFRDHLDLLLYIESHRPEFVINGYSDFPGFTKV
jgi:hypothetical protein